MTELKTLKDLEQEPDDWEEEDLIRKKTLKQEAIKWVKFYGKDGEIAGETSEAFMKFFNLTEEDLK